MRNTLSIFLANATALLDETPLPDSRTVNNGNVETLELVKSFKVCYYSFLCLNYNTKNFLFLRFLGKYSNILWHSTWPWFYSS